MKIHFFCSAALIYFKFLSDNFHELAFVYVRLLQTRTMQKNIKRKFALPEANQKSLTFNSRRLPHRPLYTAAVQCIRLYENQITQSPCLDLFPPKTWRVFFRFWAKQPVTQSFLMCVISKKYFEGGGGH